MGIKVIPLSQLTAHPEDTLTACADSGESLVVELPDRRLVSIQPLEPGDPPDDLVDDLIARDPSFRALLERSRASPRRPLFGRSGALETGPDGSDRPARP